MASPNRSNDENRKSLFTLDGYIKIFDTCENDAAVFFRLPAIIGDEINEDIWRQELQAQGYEQEAHVLFDFWKRIDNKKRNMDRTDFVKYIQLFSLLENVFRNVLLRPYIPAYRVINKHCNRYRCFVTDSEKKLFKDLHFHDYPTDLLVYEGTDILQTIIFAVTCNIFWHVLSMDLAEYHPTRH